MSRLFPVLLSLTLLQIMSGEELESTSMPTILTKSPFLPPDFQPPGTPGQATQAPKGKQQYEFRGVYELGGVYHYNLYSSTEKKGQWITQENAQDNGFNIVEYNMKDDSLVVLVDGEPMDLHLVETSDKPMAISNAGRTRATMKTAAISKTKARRRVIRPTTKTPPKPPSTPKRRAVRRTPSNP